MPDYRIKKKISLIDYLTNMGFTRTKVKQLLRHRAIGVNSREAAGLDHILLKGDTVSLSTSKKDPKKVLLPLGMRIVYEDKNLIVIEKPSGLLTIASERERIKTAYFQLNEFLRLRAPAAGERVFIVHRLDRDTSGLIVFAKNEKVKLLLQGSWDGAEKRYYAVVEGTPAKKEGDITSRLSESRSLKVYSESRPDEGKLSKTKYRLLRKGREYALLDIVLETGRKNQIRVHLADLGHPVAGDKKYGAKTSPIGRLALHSYFLSFKHPVTGNKLRFESNLPEKLKMLIS